MTAPASPAAETANPSLAVATCWRQALTAGRAQLRTRYFESDAAPELLHEHCKLVDHVLTSVWREIAMPAGISLVAVGGYGRGELFPYSDIDLLLLLDKPANDVVQGKLEQLIGLLWDIGIEVGHSVRTVEECVEEIAKDVTVQTNLLEARLLAGSPELFSDFAEASEVVLDPQAFFEAKSLEQQQRHLRFHDTAYNLEPNLKESPGGLRDLQTILWITRACGLGISWQEICEQGLITQQEAQQIERRELLLQNLRIRLHYLAGRREDRLLFDFQTGLAEQFGLKESDRRRASEQLMQRYYRAAKTVRQLNTILLQNLHARLFPEARCLVLPIDDDFQVRNELLEARSEDLFERKPGAILDSFLILQKHPELKGMSAETLRALWRARTLIDATFRENPLNREKFMEILRQPRGITHELRRMNQYDILGRYIPAFGRIVGQMQHDLFHVYTVDEHILMVVRNLRRFAEPQFAHEYPLCSQLIHEFERHEVLMLAGLFHDIAKGRGGDHSTLGVADARRFCEQHNVSSDDTELVCWLVQSHLVMSATAQKQDLSDPDVIAAFASKILNDRYLVALYLLTVADIRGTSPKVWNAWKAKLLEDLFKASRRYLAGNAINPETSIHDRSQEALRILRLYAVPEGAQQALWSQLDNVYFLRHEPQEIAWHTRLLYYRVNTEKPVVRARLGSTGEGLQVMVYLPDQQDLFARISSFFGRLNYNILEAKIHTTKHGYALDTFVVMDPSNKTPHYRDLLNFVEYELTQRLTEKSPLDPPVQGRLSRHLKHFPLSPQVSIVPDEKGMYHVLSIIAGDRPGLLSRITHTLVAHQISVHNAKINTLGERAEDTFLISGESLNDEKKVLQLETDLLGQLRV